jgi:hypothetical protein
MGIQLYPEELTDNAAVFVVPDCRICLDNSYTLQVSGVFDNSFKYLFR